VRERDRLGYTGLDEDNSKMDLQEVGFGSMDWIDVGQGRNRWRALIGAVMNRRVP
jgi:hypothetical protein